MKSEKARNTYRRTLGGVMLGLAAIAVILLLLDHFAIASGLQGILAYSLGLLLGTALIAVIGWRLRIGPSGGSKPGQVQARKQESKEAQIGKMDARDRQSRYWLFMVFFGFFILAMLVNLVGYVMGGATAYLSGFWSTTMILGFGLANLASTIHKSRPMGVTDARGEAERDKCLNRWFVVFLVLAVAWFAADRTVLPQMGPDLAPPFSSMLAGLWLILAGLTYLLYVVGFARK